MINRKLWSELLYSSRDGDVTLSREYTEEEVTAAAGSFTGDWQYVGTSPEGTVVRWYTNKKEADKAFEGR